MDKNCEQALPYVIRGRQLNGGVLDRKGQKIIWRTDKSMEEIKCIMQKIQQRIYNLAENFDIDIKDVKIYPIPLDYNEKKFVKIQNIHSCHYDFTKSLPKSAFTKRAKYCLKTKTSRFLTRNFIIHANRKLKLAIKEHLIFCKNTPSYANVSKIKVNAHIFLCKNKDWIAEYKQSIKPVVCSRFYIRPSWHEKNVSYENLIIDPSLSFGSGHHATTAMCISMLDSMVLDKKVVLDVGCGSGVLSLVAAKLGAYVYACDTDVQACVQSMKNFQINNLTYRHIWQGSMQTLETLEVPKQYDLICANIVNSVLLLLQKDFAARLKQGGILIISGILQEHERSILERFCSFSLLEKKQIDEWLCFKFIKK